MQLSTDVISYIKALTSRNLLSFDGPYEVVRYLVMGYWFHIGASIKVVIPSTCICSTSYRVRVGFTYSS